MGLVAAVILLGTEKSSLEVAMFSEKEHPRGSGSFGRRSDLGNRRMVPCREVFGQLILSPAFEKF